MKTWRTIAAAAAAFALAATIGCNADSANDEKNSAPEPAAQDGGQSETGGTDAPADNPAQADEGGSGGGQGAGQGSEPSVNAGGGSDSGSGDQPVDLPMPIGPAEPQTDAPAGDGGNDADGSMSILPIIEPGTKVEKLPDASGAAEPAGPGLTPPDGNASSQGAGVNPDTTVEHRASIGGSDAVAGAGPSAPANYGDGREPAPVVKAKPAPGPK
jgi:hypothetical protein